MQIKYKICEIVNMHYILQFIFLAFIDKFFFKKTSYHLQYLNLLLMLTFNIRRFIIHKDITAHGIGTPDKIVYVFDAKAVDKPAERTDFAS